MKKIRIDDIIVKDDEGEVIEYRSEYASELNDVHDLYFSLKDSLTKDIKEINDEILKNNKELDEKVKSAKVDQLFIISFYTVIIFGIVGVGAIIYNVLSENKMDDTSIIVLSLVCFIIIVLVDFLFMFSLNNLFKMNNNVGKYCDFYIKENTTINYRKQGYEKVHCMLAIDNDKLEENHDGYSIKKCSMYKNCKKCKNFRTLGVALTFVGPISVVFLCLIIYLIFFK